MATHAAASCALADVQAAYALCSDGDTITLPAGSATWNSYLPWIRISVYIIGAGVDQTIITSNYTDPNRGGNPYNQSQQSTLFQFYPLTPANDPAFRLSGMTIDCNLKCGAIFLYNPTSLYPCRKIRLDHLKIINCGDANGYQRFAVGRYGPVYGVMDNCDFNGMITNQSMGAMWTHWGFDFGTADNFYIEDCYWRCGTGCGHGITTDGNNSPRYSIRHSTIDIHDMTIDGDWPFGDIHGTLPSAGYLSSQGVEMYENTFILGSKGIDILDQRGGKVLVYNNNFTSDVAGLSFCKVRQEWLESFPSCAPATNAISGQHQHISDSYYWGNRENGIPRLIGAMPFIQSTVDFSQSQVYGGETAPACDPFRLVPAENKDFWVEKIPFDGTSGVGIGNLAQRPTSGLVAGVGYWDSVNHVLYRAAGPTTWQAYYAPYTYPHPLRTESYPGPGQPTVLTTTSAAILLSATGITLGAGANSTLVMNNASLGLITDQLLITPVEPSPWDIWLGPEGAEILLPAINWPSGSSPEMPIGKTSYVDKVGLIDGSVRYNFRTYAPRSWSLTWERLSASDVAAVQAVCNMADVLHFQNKWIDANWRWVIVTECTPIPIAATFATGGPFYKLSLTLEEIL